MVRRSTRKNDGRIDTRPAGRLAEGAFRARLALLFAAALSLTACSAVDLLNATSILRGGSVERGIAYGDLPRQRMDIYRPDGADAATPVVMFVYGGSWDSGQRGDYAFVGEALANEGFIAVIPDYRVHPQVTFPAFVEDTALAFARVKRDVAGDRPVFVMGHSAGAHIASLLVLDPTYLRQVGREPCRDVAGLIGASGPYDLLPLTEERYKRVFPVPVRQRAEPLDYAPGRHPPSLLVHSRDDTVVVPERFRAHGGGAAPIRQRGGA